MLDPMRQAALKKSMGYFDKWANSYNGPTYQGPLVAGRTADWYKAQDMAHRLSNRFAEGGLTNLRRFDDGGLTLGSLEDKAVNAGYQGDYTDTAAMNSFINANNQSVAPAVTQQPAVQASAVPSTQVLNSSGTPIPGRRRLGFA
jgi:hypothetical protein